MLVCPRTLHSSAGLAPLSTPAPANTGDDPRAPEHGAWTAIDGTWRRLHGSFADLGLSIEWHDFRLARDMDWGRSFHPGSLEVCLNFSALPHFVWNRGW